MKDNGNLMSFCCTCFTGVCIVAVSMPIPVLGGAGSSGWACALGPPCLKSMSLATSAATDMGLVGFPGGTLTLVLVLSAKCPSCVPEPCTDPASPTAASASLNFFPSEPGSCQPWLPAGAPTFSFTESLNLPACSATGTFTPYTIEVPVPLGTPVGLYCAYSSVRVTFSDGMVLTASGHTEVCIAPPVTETPGVPRLSLTLLSEPAPRCAPGDGAVVRYEVRNNDPINSVSLTAIANSRQSALRPQGANERQGVFAISNPFGEDFPIMFNPGETCLPLPARPYFQAAISTALPVIPPGGTNLVTVGIRSYGQCASGSCSESTLRVTGMFADGSSALACAGMALIVDASIPSTPCGREVNDCNNNGIPDALDIAARNSMDANFNAIPDECEEILHVPITALVDPAINNPGQPIFVRVAFDEAMAVPMVNVWANGIPLTAVVVGGLLVWQGTIPADTRVGPQTVYFLGLDQIGSLATAVANYDVVPPPTITPILRPGDPIMAIDTDVTSRSSYPGAEAPYNALDDNPATKYLNYAGPNSGFIVTPFLGAATVRSLKLTTANDEEGRDPASFALYGTSDPISSVDNGDGSDERWTLISSGPVSLPTNRLTPGPLVSFSSNFTSYSSFRLVFPTLKTGPYMQVADVALFESTDGSGINVLSIYDDIRAIHLPSSESRYPLAESPGNALDGQTGTKYLNLGRENSGFIVSPDVGRSVVKYFQFTTANDYSDRDPAAWALYGTDDPIQSTDNSDGSAENWTLIDSGNVSLPVKRSTPGGPVPVVNDLAYTSYRMVITAVRNPAGTLVDSVQYSEIQFFGLVLPWNCSDSLAGLVGWWPGGGNGNDIAGVHSGILENGATFAAGKVGTGFSLDGVDDRVVVPNLPASLPENEITVEFWQKVNAVVNQSTFSLSAFDPAAVFNAHVPYGDGRVYWDFGDINNGGRLDYLPPESLVGSWQHFALVASQSGNYMRIYRNGVMEAFKSGMTPLHGSGDLLIGGLSFVPFGGVIDEFSIYDRALSPAEIQGIYRAGSAGKCVVPLAITGITKPGNTVTLSWQSQRGLLYRVQYKADLTMAAWLDLPGDVTASGATASAMDSLASGAQRFYRVEMFR